MRECHVYSELLPHDTPWEEIQRRNPKGIILSGSPASVYDENSPRCDPRVFSGELPVLGICFGQIWLGRGRRRCHWRVGGRW